ncbi:hypothetical protein HYX12_00915 [Candidatus Woesearchaeota archaeon]|nr:hypothetical protein [Candidatus Woesearchaeota archaeon]
MVNQQKRELIYEALIGFGSGHLIYYFRDGTQQDGWFEKEYIDSERHIMEHTSYPECVPILTTGMIRECSVDSITRIESNNFGEERRRLLFRDEE